MWETRHRPKEISTAMDQGGVNLFGGSTEIFKLSRIGRYLSWLKFDFRLKTACY